MDELIKISDVIKICKSFTLYNNTGTNAFFNHELFPDLLRTCAVDVDKYSPRWISVKDRLPDKSVSVLICANGHRVTAYYDKVKEVFRLTEDDNLYYLTECVTHWQPLPELPNEEYEEDE